MQFTDEVRWTWFDFAVASTLLLAAGLTYAIAARRTQNSRRKLAIGIAVAAVLFIVWAQLAVGIIPGLPGGT